MISVKKGRSRANRERSAFGQRMHNARLDSGLTQEDVQQALGISQSNLSGLEGAARSSKYTAQLAALYGRDANWLATGIGTPDTSAPALSPDDIAVVRDLRDILDTEERKHWRADLAARAEHWRRMRRVIEGGAASESKATNGHRTPEQGATDGAAPERGEDEALQPVKNRSARMRPEPRSVRATKPPGPAKKRT